jgi:prepilin-type N-terminal cleavage/methylation domain-containing protein
MTRRGYTAIELLIVFTIIAIIAVAAAPAVVATLKRSAFNQAAEAVRDASTQSQLLAMRAPDGIDGELYGVRLRWDAGSAEVAVVLGDQVVGDQTRRLPPSVVVRRNGLPMADGDEVLWHYRPTTGQLMKRMSARTYRGPGAQVGLPLPDLTGTPGLTASDVHQIADQSDASATAEPGLELSTRDGSLRSAIRIYASGLIILEDRSP